MQHPIAVLISDVHYNLQTLELADAAMRQAILRANTLGVPLIVAGDLHDSKANLRAEVVNRLIETLKLCNNFPVILRGNHDSLNERSKETALQFLDWNCLVVNEPSTNAKFPGITFVPYMNDSSEFKTLTKDNGIIIAHQGITGSNSGEYLQDKSAITKQDVAGLRVISGHYHARQTIDLPDDGKWDYIGNPYTLNFGEANDPPKGFQILMSDGSLEFIPTNLRKHVVINLNDSGITSSKVNKNDILLVKATVKKEDMHAITKNIVRKMQNLPIDMDFRLELLPISSEKQQISQSLTQHEILDKAIDQLDATDELKTRLKTAWRQM